MIVVLGQPRTGTSLVMQILAAAGADCLGKKPAYEDDRFTFGPFPFDELGERQAVKMLAVDWKKRRPPRISSGAHVFLTYRNREQQIASEHKLFHLVNMRHRTVPPMGRVERRLRRKDWEYYEKQIREYALASGNPVTFVQFEMLIRNPKYTVTMIRDALGFGDVREMVNQVRPRAAGNYPGLLELSLC